MKQLQVFDVIVGGGQSLATEITKVVNAWLEENGDSIEGAPIINVDSGGKHALVSVVYTKEEPKE